MNEDEIIKYLDNGRFHLIIMPTEKCNFRCTYCYEDFTNGKMCSQVVEGIKKLIIKRSVNLHTLEIGWFGGEPLLNLKLVEEISSFAKKLMMSNNGRYISSMSTNGYLLDVETAKVLSEKGVTAFQITIDGDNLAHDRTRVLVSGSGTFDQIWDNLLKIRDSEIDLNICLRLHLTRNNLAGVTSIVSQINEEFSFDSRFKVYVKEVRNLGGDSFNSSCLIEKNEVENLKFYVESLLSKNLVLSEDRSKPSVCYASAGNSLVIRSNGEVSKCTVFLNDKYNRLGNISSDGTLKINNALYGKWVSAIFRSESAFCPVNHVKELL